MATTFIGIFIAAFAMEVDKFTQYKYNGLPLVALAGVITAITTLVL